jgi:hypothetical protein
MLLAVERSDLLVQRLLVVWLLVVCGRSVLCPCSLREGVTIRERIVDPIDVLLVLTSSVLTVLHLLEVLALLLVLGTCIAALLELRPLASGSS